MTDGDRKGTNWGNGGGWADATYGSWPDWVEVDFSGAQTIGKIDVFTKQDNYTSPSDPTPDMTFTKYGITDFDVQYWNGSGWVTVPGGSVTGNNHVWRTFNFPAVTTARIRVLVHNSSGRLQRRYRDRGVSERECQHAAHGLADGAGRQCDVYGTGDDRADGGCDGQ